MLPPPSEDLLPSKWLLTLTHPLHPFTRFPKFPAGGSSHSSCWFTLYPSVSCSLSLFFSPYIMGFFLSTPRKQWLLTSLERLASYYSHSFVLQLDVSALGRISVWALGGVESAGSLFFLVLLKNFFQHFEHGSINKLSLTRYSYLNRLVISLVEDPVSHQP